MRIIVPEDSWTPIRWQHAPPVDGEQNWQYLLRGRLAQLVRGMESTGQIWSTANGHLLIDIQPLQVETDGSSILDVAGAPC